MPFAKGESGNPGGRKVEKAWTDAIRLVLSEEHKATGQKKLRVLASKLVDEALDGNVVAMKEVGDRLEGKPAQRTELVGDPEAPLLAKVIWDHVESANSETKDP